MKILMIGDIVATTGCQIIKYYLPEIRKTYQPDVIVANGENAAENGKGIRRAIMQDLYALGVDCITLGNHSWAQAEIFDFIDRENRLLRPANYPEGTPGMGWVTLPIGKERCTIISLMGRTFFNESLECPFRTMKSLLEQIPSSHYIFVDFHAETTSEKQSLAWFLDGKVSAVVGTHTHVQTADERILPNGTGYLSDVGMVGAYDGILGMEREPIIKRFITQLPTRFEVAKGTEQFNAVLIELDSETKKARTMKRIRIDRDHPWIN